MTDKKITEYDVVDFTKSSTKVLGVKSGRTKQVTLGDAAEHDAADFAAANHTHSDMVKTVTVNGTTYSPTNGNVSFDVQGGSVTVDNALSDSSENPVQNKVVKGAIDAKVDAVSGKGLSTNDYTTDEKNKLSGIESGAEVNVIESVSVNNTPLTPSSKGVNIDLSGYAQSSDLASVATSGDYTDLQNTPNLSTVATSGSYSDLDNKPTIPTKMSQLENDKRYIQNMEAVEMDGYKQLFYIESDGTQGITTPIIPNQNTGFEIEYMSSVSPTASNAPQIINAGGRGTQNRFAISLYKASGLAGEVMIKTTSITAKIDANARQILKYINDGTNKTVIYTDGSTATVEASGDWTAKDTGGNDAPLVLFGLKTTTGYDRCFSGRLYRLKIYNLETLAYDFVPAMRKSDNVVGLYEAVNDVFYTDDRVGATPFGHGDDEILDRVSQLIMDRNIVSDNNFTNAYKNKIDTNVANIASLQSSVAADFDSTASYTVGDYVMYDGVLYRCVTAHSGVWAAADFTAAVITDELKPVSSNITNTADAAYTLSIMVGGVDYVLSNAATSLTVTAFANTSVESSLTFTVSGGSFDVTLPSGTKIIGDKPIFLSGSSYIISQYKGMVVFGELTNYTNPT